MFFFFNDTATTEIYTLSLHDALPISTVHEDRANVSTSQAQDELRQRGLARTGGADKRAQGGSAETDVDVRQGDRKSTRLNSSHANISYAVFCLKKTQTGHPRPALLVH